MIAIFIIGIVITLFTTFVTYHLFTDNNIVENIKESWDDTPVFTFSYFVLTILGWLMIYFGFTTPSSDISHITDNGNGTMTVVEYSISGDSTIINNVKSPKESYGVITNIKKHTEYHGVPGKTRHIEYITVVTVKTNSGKVFTKTYNNRGCYTKTSDKGSYVKVNETYYPKYSFEITY